MSQRTTISLLLASLLAAALASAGAPAASALAFTTCANGTAFSCTQVPVPLDRLGQVPGTIGLSVERKTAGASQSASAVVVLAGGPGQAALGLGDFVAKAIAPALSARDLLVFDQRGTGTSDPLSCPAQSSVEKCALELGPARGFFTSQDSVQDIEAIRAAFGYEKLVLYGTSYGTKVALDYATRYPQHVESLVLDSTVAPNGPDPFRLSTFKAIAPVLGELCSARACTGVTDNPVADMAHLIARLRTHPLKGEIYDGDGRRVPLSLRDGAADVFGLLAAGDLNPAVRAELPAAIHAALNKDSDPLLRLLALTSSHGSSENDEVNNTLFLATTCEETPFPWQRAAPESTRVAEVEQALRALPSADFYPFNQEAALLGGPVPECVGWPDASPSPPPLGALPDVPTLILSGAQDLRTPTENARQVAALIPDAQVEVVPYTGHSVIGSDLSGCAQASVTAFFAAAPVRACPSARNLFAPTPVPPTRLASVPGAARVGGTAGRALSAALDTLLDYKRAVVLTAINSGAIPYGSRIGGLRGGSASLSKTGARLNRLSYVPGVEVSGLVSVNLLLHGKGAPARLKIEGAGGGGTVQIGPGNRVSGVIGGRRFTTLSARAASARASWPEPDTALPHARAAYPH
ncbi:MAG TPA: alpha/beta fold hydrolase [Solirubrobacteraceae bacterium]|jgi:pimeloyl-ACP methyl ester carboxylesterase